MLIFQIQQLPTCKFSFELYTRHILKLNVGSKLLKKIMIYSKLLHYLCTCVLNYES